MSDVPFGCRRRSPGRLRRRTAGRRRRLPAQRSGRRAGRGAGRRAGRSPRTVVRRPGGRRVGHTRPRSHAPTARPDAVLEGGSVNWDLANQSARQVVAAIGDRSERRRAPRRRGEAFRLADTGLDDATSFPADRRVLRAHVSRGGCQVEGTQAPRGAAWSNPWPPASPRRWARRSAGDGAGRPGRSWG